jgi:hypothetical protein
MATGERKVARVAARKRLAPPEGFEGVDDAGRVEHVLRDVDGERPLVPRQAGRRAQPGAPTLRAADPLAHRPLLTTGPVALNDHDVVTDGGLGRDERVHRVRGERHAVVRAEVVGTPAEALDPSVAERERDRRGGADGDDNRDGDEPAAVTRTTVSGAMFAHGDIVGLAMPANATSGCPDVAVRVPP